MHRWYECFKKINDGKIHEKPSDFYQDEVYAFFMNCYHLKIGLKNDPAAASVADKVEDYINNNPELSLCADICNGLKHFRLDRERSEESPKFGPRKYKVGLGTGPTTIAAKYTINTSSVLLMRLKLLQNAWKLGKFLVSRSLREETY